MIDICTLLDGNKTYYIYGTADFGKYCYKRLIDKYGESIVKGFIESVPYNKECYGKTVYNPEQVSQLVDCSTMIIITGFTNFAIMKQNLINCGIPEEMIVVMNQYKPYFQTDYTRRVSKVCFWPELEDNEDLVKKITWFIPDKIEVIAFTKDNKLKNKMNSNINFANVRYLQEILDMVDYILIWNVEKESLDLKKYGEKIRVVDSNFFYLIEAKNFNHVYYNSFTEDEKEEMKQKSIEVLNNMKHRASAYKRANIFCTGPSIEEIYGRDLSDDFNVICNSMVKDKALLRDIKPQLLTYGDICFYMSPNEYGRVFYQDVLEGFRKYNYFIAVHYFEIPLLCKHFPELKGNLLGIVGESCEANIPSEEKFFVRGANNIFTMFMLPLAMALCDEIGVAGCTGRNPDETYFWKHNGRSQYLELMQSVFDMYPSFFRDQDYEDYYDVHCQTVKLLIEYGEKVGKKFYNMTTSFIEALRSRTE